MVSLHNLDLFEWSHTRVCQWCKIVGELAPSVDNLCRLRLPQVTCVEDLRPTLESFQTPIVFPTWQNIFSKSEKVLREQFGLLQKPILSPFYLFCSHQYVLTVNLERNTNRKSKQLTKINLPLLLGFSQFCIFYCLDIWINFISHNCHISVQTYE